LVTARGASRITHHVHAVKHQADAEDHCPVSFDALVLVMSRDLRIDEPIH
jgi:hypothetical protein